MRTHPLLHIKKTSNRLIDKAMLGAAVIHPFSSLPQIWKIYTTHDVTSLSLATWLGYSLIGIIFLSYALVHKIKPLILTQALWFGMDGAIILGILLFR